MPNKKRVNIVVTDLDDTIWDWLKMWHNSFHPYLIRIAQEFNIDENLLKSDFKKIHERYGSTETSFIYQELTCLTSDQISSFDKPSQMQKGILHEYYSLKKHNLTLHKGVLESLKKLKEKGTLIIGFTESNAFFTKYRLKHLELDGLIDFIYAPIDFGVPKSVYKHYSEDHWEPDLTEIRYLSKDVKKPAPEILEIILRDFNAKKENAIYIGDKLDKDIFMANQAEVDSVYAKYGHLIDSEKYQLLREVTHWTKEDVQRENVFKEKHQDQPMAKYTLNKSFKELFNYFEFFSFDLKPNAVQIENITRFWEKTIDVQQHFNDIELRIRNFALTTFTFIIGSIGYLEKEDLVYGFYSYDISASSLMALLGVIILLAFLYMDKSWYHRLLLGAVNHGSEIETKWGRYLPGMGLTRSIGSASPNKLFKWKIHTNHKIYIFYGFFIFILIALGIILFFV